MRVIVGLILVLCSQCLASPVREDVNLEHLYLEEIQLQASADDVTFHLYSQKSLENGEIVTKENISSTQNFDPKRKTVFVTHGWNNDFTSNINVQIKGGLLELYDLNLIVVDWKGPANRNYITAQRAVVIIGQTVGGFINHLVETLSVDLSQVILIGHSLGAHVSGNAGAAVNGQVATILGLDPARPLFTYNNTENRLDPTDADYVYVMHTSGGLLGFQKPIGHCDFFPNSGEHQPGCGLDLDGTCGHSRAYEYYVESLKSDKFVSYKCENYNDYKSGKCKDNEKASMGGFDFDKNLQGSFYLDTNYKSPYAKG